MNNPNRRPESVHQRRMNELHDMIVLAHDELSVLAPSLNNVENAKRYLQMAQRTMRATVRGQV